MCPYNLSFRIQHAQTRGGGCLICFSGGKGNILDPRYRLEYGGGELGIISLSDATDDAHNGVFVEKATTLRKAEPACIPVCTMVRTCIAKVCPRYKNWA